MLGAVPVLQPEQAGHVGISTRVNIEQCQLCLCAATGTHGSWYAGHRTRIGKAELAVQLSCWRAEAKTCRRIGNRATRPATAMDRGCEMQCRDGLHACSGRFSFMHRIRMHSLCKPGGPTPSTLTCHATYRVDAAAAPSRQLTNMTHVPRPCSLLSLLRTATASSVYTMKDAIR
jgi:hypothetical protein